MLTCRLVGLAVASVRSVSTAASRDKFKILIVGGGTGGLSVAHQIYDRFKRAGKSLSGSDIAILDGAEYHYYQPGWTLVGAGLRYKSDFRHHLQPLISHSTSPMTTGFNRGRNHITHIPDNVLSFSPSASSVTTESGRTIAYDTLVVAAGLQINWNSIPGLSKALVDPSSGVSSIYSYDTCDKVWSDIETLRSGQAIFTQPASVIKCAGAPQKIMWMAWDRFQRTGRGGNVTVDFITGMPTMFSVKKYSDALEALRIQRGVRGHFQHDLVTIDPANRKAKFKKADEMVEVDYILLHVTPPMGPLDVLKGSPISDATGWVEVDKETLRHVKPEFGNVWALGDCSSLPTSKTAAAITAQAPVLVENLFSVMDTGELNRDAKYDGYTSCPLLTGYGELMLAEFKYGLEPKESFYPLDQSVPRQAFYHLKKDFLPWAYWNFMVKGKWFGTKGFRRPTFGA